MTSLNLIRNNLRFYFRAHLGVILGSAVGSAALVGALVVGDSVRESLRRQSLERLGPVEWSLQARDRLFREALATEWNQLSQQPDHPLAGRTTAALLQLPATAALPDGSARANQIQLIGVTPSFETLAGSDWDIPEDGVLLNARLADQLRVSTGDVVLVRVQKPSSLSREAIGSPQSDQAVALRLEVAGVVPPEHLGNFSLLRSQIPPFNAFLPLSRLQRATGTGGQANLLLLSQAETTTRQSARTNAVPWQRLLRETWKLADVQLQVTPLPQAPQLELHTPRVFLDPPVVEAARRLGEAPLPVLTYLVNLLEAGERATPYSMVTATTPPLLPEEVGQEEIVVNQWLADDLQLAPGDNVRLTYYLADSGASLVEKTNDFTVHSIVPMELPYADRSLMPEFPGVATADSAHDFDAGFSLVHEIRSKDEDYWQEWRGTPKAFLPLPTGQRLWGNRFGDLTALRFRIPDGETKEAFAARLGNQLLDEVSPDSLGLVFEPVRAQALNAVSQSQDFAGLFIGFSFFLVAAALILMALLFQFGLETRLSEIGTLLALGFPAGQVRRLWLLEGLLLSLVGGALGVAGGVAYAKALLLGLTTLWRDAVGTSALSFHAQPNTLVIGLGAAVIVSTLTIAWVLRREARQPARVLLAGTGVEGGEAIESTRKSRKAAWIALASLLAAGGLVGWAMSRENIQAGAFFGAGSLLLIGGIAALAAWLRQLGRSSAIQRLSLAAMGLRSITRQRKRSLATVALLAAGCFMIAAVGANRLDADLHADQRSSGTGGFAWIGQSTIPILRDLTQPDALIHYGLDPQSLEQVRFVPMRLREGDDASCLNLTRAQKPRLLGVDPEQLASRNAFTFTSTLEEPPDGKPWKLLHAPNPAEADVIPAIGDANSIQWALGKKVGDTLDYTDERGRPFRVRIVGAVANSILQGNLLIDEKAFQARFPTISGYRMFLIDAPSNRADSVARQLSRAFEDAGLELTPAPRRLAAFNAVQNTYLETFQILGGIGLLLGSAGLGVVVLRNVLERRGELALLQAVGFRRRSLQWLVLSEHAALLWLGLLLGLIAALVAVLPVLLRPGGDFPVAGLAVTLGAVLLTGLLWTWLATRYALRGALLPALRNE